MKNINAMKNINSFIKSHCGFGGISSVSRRYLVLLTTLLSIGVGQTWADYAYLDLTAFTSWYNGSAKFRVDKNGTGDVDSYTEIPGTGVWRFDIGNYTGAVTYKRMSSDYKSQWDYFNGSISSTQNVAHITGWSASGSMRTTFVINYIHGTNYIYFDNSVSNFSGNIYFVIGHDYSPSGGTSTYSTAYKMTQLTGTKLWYVKVTDTWEDATYYAVVANSGTISDHSWGSSSLSSKGNNGYTAAYKTVYNMEGGTYMLNTASAGNNNAMTITYYSGYSNIPTNSMTASVRTKVAGGTYGNSFNSPTTVTVQTRYLSNNGTSNTQSASVTTSAKTASKADVTTGQVNYSYTALADDAQWKFDGWGTSNSTVSSTSSTYQIAEGSAESKTATTIYAFFTRKPILTVNKGTNGSSASGTATDNDKTIWNISATPNTGYSFASWSTTTGSVTYGSSTTASTTATVSADATITATYTENKTSITITTDGHGTITTPSSVSNPYSLGVATTQAINASPNTGYHWNTWTVSGNAALASTATTQSNTAKGNGTKGGSGTVTATFTPNTYTVHFHRNGGAGTTVYQNFTYDVAQNLTANSYTRTGYTFAGWATAADGEKVYDDEEEVSNLTAENSATFHLYAKWTANTYTITLTQEGETGYDSEHSGTESVTATYYATMPAIGRLPIAANGYKFMGYFTDHNGGGKQLTNESGNWIASVTDYTDASKNWVRDDNLTLYAYFKKAEITGFEYNATVFDPVTTGTGASKDSIILNPTIVPVPQGTTSICWSFTYDNGNPLPSGHDAVSAPIAGKPNRVRFSIIGLAAGSYKVTAKLYKTASGCSAGEENLLDTYEQTFSIASGFTVTIQYKDAEDNTIATSTTTPGKATDWTSVTAPDIFGYTFSTWVPGDGITLQSTATTNSNKFQTTFNGTLTAKYTKNKYIYLDLSQTFGSGKWDNPWVYFYTSAGYWGNDNKGAGATDAACVAKGAMTQIEGTDIWYYDYSSVPASFGNKLAFTWGDKHDQLNFYDVDAIYRTDFSEGTPLFVPAVGQSVEQKNDNHGHYYNKGYWTNYVGDKTGYTVIIYDNSTNAELKRQRFTSVNNDMRMSMKATLDLDAATTYKIDILRDNGKSYKNSGKLTNDNHTSWAYTESASIGTILSSAAGSYVFTLNYSPSTLNRTDFELRLTVDYPAAAKDFQILYHDNATWSLGSAHSATWIHPSRIIRARENGVDTISFFVAQGEGISAQLKARKVSSINASTGAITWGDLNINDVPSQSLTVDSAAVWNFKVTQGTAGEIISIEKIGAYRGNYYIRSNALNSNWDNYTTDGDHLMTYSSFSESAANSFGDKYSHYKAKWCPRNTNIAFCIANDYSPCITDTLKQDVGGPAFNNTESDGTLKYEKTGENMKYNDGDAYKDKYSANVRFMWNRKTNKISRAYVSSATSTNAKFLVLQGSGTPNSNIYDGSTGAAFTDETPGGNSVILNDDQNWIYEVTVQANPSALVKLYANYCDKIQWFRGATGDFTEGTTAIQILGGTASESKYSVRVIYDFKTNRLVCAWVPSGTSQTIASDLTVNADVMIVREHHESAQCITFANNAKMTSVKNVYGVMRFNRWILNNRSTTGTNQPLPVDQQKSTYERRLYFISFPFDVRVGDIFGFGQYGQYWVIQYYDGLNRAKNGYWSDSKPNWKYVSPSMVSQGYTLKANEGYILELNLNAMAADNTTFWSNGISTIELYFPSTVAQETLKQTNCTIPALSADYECKINRGTGTDGDRRVKDSYWRCIGVPSYNLYNSTLTDGSGNEIRWNTDYTWQSDDRAFPFIYVWNKTDNTLTPQSTSAFTFQPMHAYLTQIKSAIVWTAVSAKDVSSIVARRARKEADNEHEWRIELKQDTTFLDQTYVRMSNMEQVTDSFDFGQDMIKELNSRSNIYTYIGYEKVAANSMTVHSDQTTVIPVGANIRADGEYTFAMPDGTSGVGVTLIDNVENTRTNLSALDYTVTLSEGEYTNRFFLEISPVQNTPTDIEAVSGQPSEVRKVMIDGILYIVRDGKMYDARGTLVHGSAR